MLLLGYFVRSVVFLTRGARRCELVSTGLINNIFTRFGNIQKSWVGRMLVQNILYIDDISVIRNGDRLCCAWIRFVCCPSDEPWRGILGAYWSQSCLLHASTPRSGGSALLSWLALIALKHQNDIDLAFGLLRISGSKGRNENPNQGKLTPPPLKLRKL